MSEISETDVTKAVSCEINLGESSLDAYMLPDGEKRFGVEGTSLALGYTKRWFYNRTKRESKWLKGLEEIGFTGAQSELSVIRQSQGQIIRGASLSKTISLRDFVKIVTYEAITQRNVKAIILLAAFAETGLERILEDAFAGRSIEFLLEKIVHYSKWTYEELEEVLRHNREELRDLYPWGNLDLIDRQNPDSPPLPADD
ncbi:hypothetical protein ACE1AT_11115 [Pelatocladus sp. BLCC-F211]|uniref:hypothetical protein n=1 Tax=Pelatocladus sp. BLCC-F211 TaxID=3342752 RepID=UPI0035B722E7